MQSLLVSGQAYTLDEVLWHFAIPVAVALVLAFGLWALAGRKLE